jgi:hypothetical protein
MVSDHCPVFAAYNLITRESPYLSVPWRDRKFDMVGSIAVKYLKAIRMLTHSNLGVKVLISSETRRVAPQD